MSKILNFGSLNLDIVYSLEHIVRPGETLSANAVENFCGGKGFNQSIALSRAGAQVYHAGKLGADGVLLSDALHENGVLCDFLECTDGKSGNALIQRDAKGENCIILFGGTNKEISTEEIDEVLTHFSKGDILISQNEISCVPYLLKAAAKKEMRIAFNPSPIGPEIAECPLEAVTWLIINEVEGAELAGISDTDLIIETLLSRYPQLKIVLTLGGEGAVYADKSCKYTQPAHSVSVVDTTAAGDTFLGYFIACAADGRSEDEALKIAAAASALAVSKAGAYPSIPTKELTEKFLREHK